MDGVVGGVGWVSRHDNPKKKGRKASCVVFAEGGVIALGVLGFGGRPTTKRRVFTRERADACACVVCFFWVVVVGGREEFFSWVCFLAHGEAGGDGRGIFFFFAPPPSPPLL